MTYWDIVAIIRRGVVIAGFSFFTGVATGTTRFLAANERLFRTSGKRIFPGIHFLVEQSRQGLFVARSSRQDASGKGVNDGRVGQDGMAGMRWDGVRPVF